MQLFSNSFRWVTSPRTAEATIHRVKSDRFNNNKKKEKGGGGCRRQVWDFIPEVWALPSLLVIPQRSQRALHLEVSASVLQPTPETDVQLGGRGGGCFSPSDQRLPSAGECRARRGEWQRMVNGHEEADLIRPQKHSTPDCTNMKPINRYNLFLLRYLTHL